MKEVMGNLPKLASFKVLGIKDADNNQATVYQKYVLWFREKY
jgi:hypothetical protein